MLRRSSNAEFAGQRGVTAVAVADQDGAGLDALEHRKGRLAAAPRVDPTASSALSRPLTPALAPALLDAPRGRPCHAGGHQMPRIRLPPSRSHSVPGDIGKPIRVTQFALQQQRGPHRDAMGGMRKRRGAGGATAVAGPSQPHTRRSAGGGCAAYAPPPRSDPRPRLRARTACSTAPPPTVPAARTASAGRGVRPGPGRPGCCPRRRGEAAACRSLRSPKRCRVSFERIAFSAPNCCSNAAIRLASRPLSAGPDSASRKTAFASRNSGHLATQFAILPAQRRDRRPPPRIHRHPFQKPPQTRRLGHRRQRCLRLPAQRTQFGPRRFQLLLVPAMNTGQRTRPATRLDRLPPPILRTPMTAPAIASRHRRNVPRQRHHHRIR